MAGEWTCTISGPGCQQENSKPWPRHATTPPPEGRGVVRARHKGQHTSPQPPDSAGLRDQPCHDCGSWILPFTGSAIRSCFAEGSFTVRQLPGPPALPSPQAFRVSAELAATCCYSLPLRQLGYRRYPLLGSYLAGGSGGRSLAIRLDGDGSALPARGDGAGWAFRVPNTPRAVAAPITTGAHRCTPSGVPGGSSAARTAARPTVATIALRAPAKFTGDLLPVEPELPDLRLCGGKLHATGADLGMERVLEPVLALVLRRVDLWPDVPLGVPASQLE